jgi:uncharacterized protein
MIPTVDMQVSPYQRGHAQAPAPAAPLVQLAYKPRQRWVPSRFNARTVGEDGGLILWNTLSGAIITYPAKHREAILGRLAHAGMTAPLDKTSEHLRERGFLVRDDVNELDRFRYRYAQGQWRTDSLQFILLASEDCNFRCVYCYEKFERGTMTPEVRQGIRALTLQRAPYLKELAVDWFGGEPLYGWDALAELSPFFKDVAERHGLHHGQQMTTNGYLLTEERATKLLDWGCRTYQITIDGLAAEHDCKRVGRDGSPTHAMILDNLRSLRARKERFRVNVRVNYDRDNFPRLGTFLEALSEDFGGDDRFRLRFRAVGKWGGANDGNLNTCGTEQRPMLRSLQSKADELGLAREGGIRDHAVPGSEVCYAARPYNFIVGATGKLMKCTIALYDMEENIVGQLHPDGTMELNDENMIRWVAPHFESDTMCRSCYLLPTCQGAQCPLHRIRDDHRTCCRVKSNLKEEMRYTLDEHARRRTAAPQLVTA